MASPTDWPGTNYECERLQKNDFFAGKHAFGDHALKFARPGEKSWRRAVGVRRHEPDIVSVVRIVRAWISENCEKKTVSAISDGKSSTEVPRLHQRP